MFFITITDVPINEAYKILRENNSWCNVAWRINFIEVVEVFALYVEKVEAVIVDKLVERVDGHTHIYLLI